MAQPTIVRPCGLLESYSTSRHSLGLYRCVALTCRYSLPSELAADPSALQVELHNAVAEVVLGEPFLQVGIIDEATPQASYVAISTIDLEKHVEFTAISAVTAEEFDAELAARLGQQHDTLWSEPGTRPPWRVMVFARPTLGDDPNLTDIEVAFAYHHAIGDGLSGKIFHSKLLRALRQPATLSPTVLKGRLLSIPKPPSLPEPQEKIVKFTLSPMFILGMLWSELGPSWLKPTPPSKPWAGAPFNLNQPYKTNVRLLTISATNMTALISACRTHSTTLTPLLHTLVLVSLATRLPADIAPTFAMQTPIALRPYVSPDSALSFNAEENFHVLVTGHTRFASEEVCATIRHQAQESSRAGEVLSTLSVQEDIIWRYAAEMRRDLKQKTSRLPADDMMGMLSWVGDWHAWLKKKDGQSRDTTWEVSNVGVLTGLVDQRNGWRVTRGVMSQSAMVAGAAIGVSVCGVAAGETTIALTWPQGTVENSLVEALVDDLSQWTCRLGSDGIFGIFMK